MDVPKNAPRIIIEVEAPITILGDKTEAYELREVVPELAQYLVAFFRLGNSEVEQRRRDEHPPLADEVHLVLCLRKITEQRLVLHQLTE